MQPVPVEPSCLQRKERWCGEPRRKGRGPENSPSSILFCPESAALIFLGQSVWQQKSPPSSSFCLFDCPAPGREYIARIPPSSGNAVKARSSQDRPWVVQWKQSQGQALFLVLQFHPWQGKSTLTSHVWKWRALRTTKSNLFFELGYAMEK